MFEMSSKAAIFSNRCPAVLFNFNFVTSGIDHGLNGQNHALPQSNSAIRLTVIRDRRLLMQLLADAMTHEGTDHRVACAFGSLLNRKAEVAQALSCMQLIDTPVECLLRDFHQPFRFLTHLPYANRYGRIAIEAIVNHPIVKTNDISFAQR